MTDQRPPVLVKLTQVRRRWMEVDKVKLLDIDWSAHYYHETTYFKDVTT